MRERKYRVWTGSEMIYDVVPFEGGSALIRFGTDDGVSMRSGEGHFYENPPEDYVGLKDKSGRDIYEGDIIRLADGAVGVVKFEPPSFFHTAITEIMGLLYWNEVIGNIHENPELLREVK